MPSDSMQNTQPNTSNNPASESSSCKKNLMNVWMFVCLSIVCSIVAWYVMSSANSRLEKTHELIISHHEKSANTFTDSLFAVYKNLVSDSLKKGNPQVLDRLDLLISKVTLGIESEQNNQRVSNLLETEFAKIQSEYEILNLWCALLTVVFLIFSFFSIFKANEMANQSEDALKTMRSVAREVQSKSESIDTKIRDANLRISEANRGLTTLEGDINALTSKYNTLKDTEVPALEERLSKLNESFESLEHIFSQARKDFDENYKSKLGEFNNTAESRIDYIAEIITKKVVVNSNDARELILERIARIESKIALLKGQFDILIVDEAKHHNTIEKEKAAAKEELAEAEATIVDSEEGLRDSDEQDDNQ